MKLALQDCGLLSVVDGTFAKPDATSDPNGYADWVSSDTIAELQIATTLRKGALNVILQASSAKDCWERLFARYEGKGGRRVVYLMQSFYRMMLTDTEPMEPQLNKLVEANRNLKTIGCGAANDKSLAYLITFFFFFKFKFIVRALAIRHVQLSATVVRDYPTEQMNTCHTD